MNVFFLYSTMNVSTFERSSTIQRINVFQDTNSWITDPFNVQNIHIDFKVTEYEEACCCQEVDMFPNCIIQLTFEKLLLVKFWYNIKQ